MEILELISEGGDMPSLCFGGSLANQAERVPLWESLGRDGDSFQHSCALVVVANEVFLTIFGRKKQLLRLICSESGYPDSGNQE